MASSWSEYTLGANMKAVGDWTDNTAGAGSDDALVARWPLVNAAEWPEPNNAAAVKNWTRRADKQMNLSHVRCNARDISTGSNNFLFERQSFNQIINQSVSGKEQQEYSVRY